MKSIMTLLAVILLTVFTAAQTTHFTSKEQSFEVTFPTNPSNVVVGQTKSDRTTEGRPYTSQAFSTENSNGAYIVVVATYSYITLDASDVETVIQASATGAGGKVMVEKPCPPTLTTPCKIAAILVEEKDSRIGVLNMVTVKGTRLYQVLFGAPVDPNPNFDEIGRYFESFKILE